MYPNHTARVRPGDKWDGLVLRLTRADMDWSRVEITAVLRRFPGGPVVKTLSATSEIAGDTLSVQLSMAGTDTAFLVLTQTYHGDISVVVPGVDPGDPPEFGPYTVATFAIEASYEWQEGASLYSLTWNNPQAIEVSLMAGGVPGLQGATGPAGPAPAGTGLVSVTNGALDTPATLRARVAGDAVNLRSDLGLGPQSTLTTNQTLIDWTEAGSYQVTSAIYDSDGVVTTATVAWPDGSAGTFTRTAKDATFLSVNAYTITHDTSSKTVTQAAVTRDSGGRVTTKPALTVAP